MNREQNGDRRRRRVISKERILVRSAKPGQSAVGVYEREHSHGSDKFWKAATYMP